MHLPAEKAAYVPVGIFTLLCQELKVETSVFVSLPDVAVVMLKVFISKNIHMYATGKWVKMFNHILYNLVPLLKLPLPHPSTEQVILPSVHS